MVEHLEVCWLDSLAKSVSFRLRERPSLKNEVGCDITLWPHHRCTRIHAYMHTYMNVHTHMYTPHSQILISGQGPRSMIKEMEALGSHYGLDSSLQSVAEIGGLN